MACQFKFSPDFSIPSRFSYQEQKGEWIYILFILAYDQIYECFHPVIVAYRCVLFIFYSIFIKLSFIFPSENMGFDRHGGAYL